MSNQELVKLKQEIKELIIEECDRDTPIDDIIDNEPLFGSGTTLELDSMDALQLSMALHKKYGIEANDSKKLRKIMVDIDSLAMHILSEKA